MQKVISKYENDPDIQPFIKLYIDVLKERLLDFRKSIEGENTDDVKNIAHKFYGTSASFGFPEICKLILEVEELFYSFKKDLCPLSKVYEKFNCLVDICSNVTTQNYEIKAPVESVFFDKSNCENSQHI